MSVAGPVFTPDLEELLREVAANPEARLLRVAPRDVALGLRSWRERASESMAGLVPEERELLRVHRAELAWLLREAAISQFHGSNRSWRVTPTCKVADLDVLRTHAMSIDPDIVGDLGDEAPLALAWRAISTDSGAVSARMLLEAALRLEVHPATFVFLANDHVAEGRFEEAVLAVQSILSRSVAAEVTVPALQALAPALDAVGDLRGAMEASTEGVRRAEQAELPPDWWGRSSVSLLIRAVRLGDRAHVRNQAEALRQREDALAGWIDRYTTGLQRTRGAVSKDEQHNARECLAPLRSEAGAHLERLIDVLLS